MAAEPKSHRRSRADRSADGTGQQEDVAAQLSAQFAGCFNGRKRLASINLSLKTQQEAIDQKKKNILMEQQPAADSDGASPAALEEGQTEKPASKGTMTELLRYPNMRRKFYILTFLWLANSVAYNGLSYNSSNLGVSDALAFFINAIVEAPAYVMTWWAMGRWGRRWPVSITMLIGGLACCACMFVPEG